MARLSPAAITMPTESVTSKINRSAKSGIPCRAASSSTKSKTKPTSKANAESANTKNSAVDAGRQRSSIQATSLGQTQDAVTFRPLFGTRKPIRIQCCTKRSILQKPAAISGRWVVSQYLLGFFFKIAAAGCLVARLLESFIVTLYHISPQRGYECLNMNIPNQIELNSG